MKKLSYYLLLVPFVSTLLLTAPILAEATSGPVGLNQLLADPGPAAGQVTLHWARYNPNVDNYSIFYGTSSGHYQYAAANIGNIVTYTVGYLQPGTRYYFFIQGYSQGSSLPNVTPELSEVAASSSVAVVGTAGPFGTRQVTAVAGPASGQVIITWRQVSAATTNYSVVYGTKPGMYQYGALNIAPNTALGVTNSYTVGFLQPGVRYYFAVVPMRGGEGIYSSGEVSKVAP